MSLSQRGQPWRSCWSPKTPNRKHAYAHIHADTHTYPHTFPYSCSPFSFINGPYHLLSQVCSLLLKTVSGGRACLCLLMNLTLEPGPGTKHALSVCWRNLWNVRSQFNFPSFIRITPKINSVSEVSHYLHYVSNLKKMTCGQWKH